MCLLVFLYAFALPCFYDGHWQQQLILRWQCRRPSHSHTKRANKWFSQWAINAVTERTNDRAGDNNNNINDDEDDDDGNASANLLMILPICLLSSIARKTIGESPINLYDVCAVWNDTAMCTSVNCGRASSGRWCATVVDIKQQNKKNLYASVVCCVVDGMLEDHCHQWSAHFVLRCHPETVVLSIDDGWFGRPNFGCARQSTGD